MAKNDFTTKIEDGRIMFMTSYRDEFGETQEVANVITKNRLIEIRDDINRALAILSDEPQAATCNIPRVVKSVCLCTYNQKPKPDNTGRLRCSECGLPV